MGVEEEAGAGEAGFGFLELGDVEGSDVKAARFDARASERKRGGENHSFAEGESVGGVRLVRVHVDPVVARKRGRFEPAAIGEKGVSAEPSNGGFEMQASGDGNGGHFVTVGRENSGELANALGIRTSSEADKNFFADAENVAAFELSGSDDMVERAEGFKSGG